MGFLDKLFEKKCCDICGGEIGLMGNRKLADGNLCKECAAKLSPLFDERRQSTVEQIREQLLYRAENEGRVAAFNPTRTLGARTKVLIDDNAGAIIVTASSRWRDVNPDVIAFDQVTGCAAEVREFKTELREKKPDGTTARYDPPRYEIEYDVWVVVNVNSPYFDEIAFKTNDARLESRVCDAYRAAVREADGIRDALASIWEDAHEGLDAGGVFGMRLADLDAERRNEVAANAAMRMATAARVAPGVPGSCSPMPPLGGYAGIPVPPQGVGYVAGAVNAGYPAGCSRAAPERRPHARVRRLCCPSAPGSCLCTQVRRPQRGAAPASGSRARTRRSRGCRVVLPGVWGALHGEVLPLLRPREAVTAREMIESNRSHRMRFLPAMPQWGSAVRPTCSSVS